MLPATYLKTRQRKDKPDLSSLKTQEDLLRAILANLEYENELATLHTQYFLLEVDESRPLVQRKKRQQLLRTMKKFVEQHTMMEDEGYEL